MTRSLDELVDALPKRSLAVLLGAGISIPNGIPAGYELPLRFGRSRPDLVAAHGLEEDLNLCAAIGSSESKESFTKKLTAAFPHDISLQEGFLSWLKSYPEMAGAPSDDHMVFVSLWLSGEIRHLITTNWDFMLERQIADIYDVAYDDPFEPAELAFSDGSGFELLPERLFHAVRLGEDDAEWRPRYDIVAGKHDLPEIDRGAKVLWKIHGSPFFLSCPRCRGVNRWHREAVLHVGDPCPGHPGEKLGPDIIFWGAGIDKAEPSVWRAVMGRLRRCEMVLVVGSSGGDDYLRKELEAHPGTWVVSPDQGQWDLARVRYVESNATELALALRSRQSSPRVNNVAAT